MLSSSAVLAPTIFSRLGADAAKPLLRAFWPRYYAINGALAVLAAVFAAQGYVGLLAVVTVGWAIRVSLVGWVTD